jgi:hypothetical protein
MTRDEWLHPHDGSTIVAAVQALGQRRARLLACACCREMGEWVSGPVASLALAVVEEFADTGQTRAALRRAREDVRAEMRRGTPDGLSAPPSDPARITRALGVVEKAATEADYGWAVGEAADALWRGTGRKLREVMERLYPLYLDIAGQLPRPPLKPGWRNEAVTALAGTMYETRNFAALPALADALEEAGCDERLLAHCRGPGPHVVRGCWVVDLVLSKG